MIISQQPSSGQPGQISAAEAILFDYCAGFDFAPLIESFCSLARQIRKKQYQHAHE